MAQPILIVDGHPDPDPARLCHQLADAYADGAEAAGHPVERVCLADLSFPAVRNAAAFETGEPPPAIRETQAAIGRARHLVFVFPIWHGTVPSNVKAFVEQVFRPGFARGRSAAPDMPGGKLLTGRSARIVATMDMPALAYRFYFGGHGLKNLSGNVLKFSGIAPVRWTLVGRVGAMTAQRMERERARLAALGRRAA